MTSTAAPRNSQYLYVSDAQGALGVFRQEYAEQHVYTFDYSEWLAPGETLVSAAHGMFPITAPAMLLDKLTIDETATKVSFRLGRGVGGATYRVWIDVVTSNGQSKQDWISVMSSEFYGGAGCGCGPLPTDVVQKLLNAAALAVPPPSRNKQLPNNHRRRRNPP
ncbi:hypothetical protein [Methylocella sp.]|uniref:phage fiber-tail adaptor protein n=1 Tax=Methylocella sp. TaxID=1978226 RepID=UPI0035B2136C